MSSSTGAVLDDAAPVEHHDAVKRRHGSQPVRSTMHVHSGYGDALALAAGKFHTALPVTVRKLSSSFSMNSKAFACRAALRIWPIVASE